MSSRKRRRATGLFFIAIVFGVAFWPAPAIASHTKQASGLQYQKVGIYLTKVGDFDPATGTFSVDLYMDLRCSKPCHPHPEFVNGAITFEQHQTDRPLHHVYRIRADLRQPTDLRNFPFEEGRLPIKLEDEIYPDTRVLYTVNDKSGLDPDTELVNHTLVPGWDAYVSDHGYPVFDATWSRFVFYIKYESPNITVFIKDVLPIALITLYALTAFLVNPHSEATRHRIATSALVALVVYGGVFLSTIPTLDYLTFADKYVVLNLLVALVALIAIIVIHNREKENAETNELKALNLKMGLGVVGLWLILQGIAAAPLL